MKPKIKTLFKILAVLLIIFIIFSNTNFSFAEENQTEQKDALTIITDGVGAVLDGIVGILTWPLRLIPLMIGGALQMLGSGVASVGGGNGEVFLTMEGILFNEIPILRVNFFETDKGNVGTIQSSVATWYYSLRNLAIVLSLVVLIYIGIRMAISTLAEDKARYKKMLTDWIIGFIAIFFLHYLILLVLYANDNLVIIFKNSMETLGLDSFVGWMAEMSLSISAIQGTTASIIYICMVALIFMFLFNYIKRMLTVAFLVIISPIITVTYSIDKIGDGKSQALNTWLKEFIYNVIIQPFHCVIYLVFMSIIKELLTSNEGEFRTIGVGTGIVAIAVMFFIKQAEPIVRKIFGFDNASTLGSAVASGALLLGSMKTAANAAGKIAGTAGGKKSPSGESGSGGSKSNKKSMPKASSNAQRNTDNMKNDAGQNGQSRNANNNQKEADKAQNAGQTSSSTGDNSNANSSQKNTQNDANSEKRELNTKLVQSRAEKLARTYGNILTKGAKITASGFGGAMGAFLSDDPVTGAMIGYNYGKAISTGGENLGKKVINGAKGIPRKVGRAVSYSKLTGKFTTNRIKRERNDIIDSMTNLQNNSSFKNYDDVEYLADSLLKVSDLDLENMDNPYLREFGQSLHRYREEFQGAYKEPDDMVLDTLRKINSGDIKHQEVKSLKFTRKKNKK